MRGQFNKLLIASIALRTLCFFYSIFVLLLNRPRMRRHLKFVRLLNSIIFFCLFFVLVFFLFFFSIYDTYIYYSLLKFLLDLYIKISLSNSNDKTSQIFICVYVCVCDCVSICVHSPFWLVVLNIYCQ